MQSFKTKLIALASTLWTFLFMSSVWAQNFGQGNLEAVGKSAGLQTGSGAAGDRLPIIVGNLIRTFISLLGVIFLVLIVYGGWLWLTARGDKERVEKAKDTITRAVIGIVIVVGAYTLTSFVLSRLITAAS